jgi:hypothetical protein
MVTVRRWWNREARPRAISPTAIEDAWYAPKIKAPSGAINCPGQIRRANAPSANGTSRWLPVSTTGGTRKREPYHPIDKVGSSLKGRFGAQLSGPPSRRRPGARARRPSDRTSAAEEAAARFPLGRWCLEAVSLGLHPASRRTLPASGNDRLAFRSRRRRRPPKGVAKPPLPRNPSITPGIHAGTARPRIPAGAIQTSH